MCVVSMVGDHYSNKWEKEFPKLNEKDFRLDLLQAQLDLLKKEVEEMKELLSKAVQYDTEHNQPHCEIEDKLNTLKKIAELVGIDLDDVLNTK